MKPYSNIRLTEGPDISDIQTEGRKSSVGRFDQKSYIRKPAKKSAVRCNLKRRDKAVAVLQFLEILRDELK